MASTATKTKAETPRKAKPSRQPAAQPTPKRDTSVNDKLILTGLETTADKLFSLKQKSKDIETQIKEVTSNLILAVRPEREAAEIRDKRAWPTAIVRSTDGECDCQVIWQHRFSKLNGNAEHIERDLGKHAETFIARSLSLKVNDDVTIESLKTALGEKAFEALSQLVSITEDTVVAPKFMEKRATLRGSLGVKAEAAVVEIEALQASPQVKTK